MLVYMFINKNMKNIKILFAAISCLSVASCGFLEPETDNTRDEGVLDEVAYFCGPLNAVYDDLPTLFDLSMDAMTDNAVIRNMSGSYFNCGVGSLSPNDNPIGMWARGYKNIRNINIFMKRMILDESTEYKTPVRFFTFNSETDYKNNLNMFWRLKGEAYILRAYWLAELLRNYGGLGENGEMLGVPLVGDRILEVGKDDLNIPRATYEECVKAIIADCDSAVVACRLPDKYTGEDPVYGKSIRQHVSGAAAKAIKARVLLYAASPAFNPAGDVRKWEAAAIAAGDAIKAITGNAPLDQKLFSSRDEYYFTQTDNIDWKNYDVIMKGRVKKGNSEFEKSHFPPQLYGNASINVTQNFVDAFPDADGYPIAESGSYNPQDPYANRDARLGLFVGHNGGKIGNYTLNTVEGGADAFDPILLTSRSNYYLKKALRMSVVLTPGHSTATPRVNILYGLPELLLNYAEAANMAWGVASDPKGYGFTAKDALNLIVTRDNAKTGNRYLQNVIGADNVKFNDYVRLQRRIEMCFEGHYYYDLRRWYAADGNWQDKLNVEIFGISISSDMDYNPVRLEKRLFASPYQPIPYSETLSAGLVQNKGWR